MSLQRSPRELAAWVLALSRAAGAPDCRVKIVRKRFVSVRYRGGKPELVSEAVTRSLSLEVFMDGHYAVQESPDFRPASVEAFVRELVERAGLTEADPFRGLPEPGRYGVAPSLDLGLLDPGHGAFSIGERHRLAKDIEQSCLDRARDAVVSAGATVYDQDYEEWVSTGKGFEGTLHATEFWAGAQLSVRDLGERKPEVWHFGGSRIRKGMPGAQEIGAIVAERAHKALGAAKIATETLPVVVENRCAGRLLHGFLEALQGRNVQQGQSFLADQLGRAVGSPAFTLTDDPFVQGGFGSRLYDGDGFPAKRRDMVARGVLKEHFLDWYYSRKLGVEPTTGGPSNLVLPAGARSVQDIIRGLGRCVLVTDFIGGNSNATTGDFSAGVAGTLYEQGRPVQAVAEMNIAGRHLDLWSRLIEVADDPWPYATLRTPSLVFDRVVVSGK
jgi:PmbA protein